MNNYNRRHDFWAMLVSESLYAFQPFAAYLSEWQRILLRFLSPEALKDWLLDTKDNADVIFCFNACNCPDCSYLDVVANGETLFAHCPEERISDITLSPGDVLIKKYDIERLHSCLASTIPCMTPSTQSKLEIHLTWLLGCLFRKNDHETRNVFISYLTPPQLQMQIPALCVISEMKPFILFSPFAECFPESTLAMFRQMGIGFVSLRQYFSINMWSGKPELLSSPEPIEDFLRRADNGSPLGIPVPPKTSWEQIRMNFLDGMTVNCCLLGKNYTRSYMDMRMVDTRTGMPDSSWTLLKIFSQTNGEIPIEVSIRNKSDRLKQQKYRLDAALRKYFGIDNPAIVLSPDHAAYLCRFKINPEAHSSAFHRKKRI